MTFQLDLVTLSSAVAILIAISTLIATWRKTSMAEGTHLEEIKHMKEKQAELEKKVEFVRGCTEETHAELKTIQTDMNWVKMTLEEIKELVRK